MFWLNALLNEEMKVGFMVSRGSEFQKRIVDGIRGEHPSMIEGQRSRKGDVESLFRLDLFMIINNFIEEGDFEFSSPLLQGGPV